MTATPSPEVVVHVASLNTAAATELCVRSMRHYAGHEFDLVVGDGGSTAARRTGASRRCVTSSSAAG
ncbi:MAG: hypothetical protein ACXV8R_06035 [Acidimicrobiia bacterium]